MKNYDIAVITSDLKHPGGADKTAVIAIKALNEIGIKPKVYTFNIASEDDIKKNYNIDLHFECKKLLDFNLPSMYKPIMKILQLNQIKKENNIIFDFITFLPLKDYKNYFHYIHFPEYGNYLYNKKYHNIKGWVYFFIRRYIFEVISKNNYKRFKNIHQVCNSYFTQEVLKKYSNIDIDVLFPPISIKLFKCDNKKRKGIVSLGRFGEDKNQFEQVKIAELLPNINFKIIGAINDIKYFNKLKKYIEKRNIKNIEFITNVSFEQIKQELCLAKLFIHSMRDEHFGMSTVEAMSAGCIPIVHNSGGQKYIVKKNDLLYENIEDAVSKIKNIYYYDNKLNEYRKFFSKEVNQYDEENFKKYIQDFVKSCI